MKLNQKIIEIIKNSNTVAIFAHTKPDGDCIGAATAMKQVLTLLNKKADVFCDVEEVPLFLSFLPYVNEINKPNHSKYDLAIALDVPNFKKLGVYGSLFRSIKNTIRIDHHAVAEDFAKINSVHPEASSACLVLYNYIKALNVKIDDKVALSLYAGIASDTGGFLHSNTSAACHEAAAELIKYNFNLTYANYMLFKMRTAEQMKLIRIALRHADYLYENKLCITYLTKKDFAKTGTTRDDSGFMVDYMISVKGCYIGVCISQEKEDLFSVSFRSKDGVDVSKLASYFGGGGHVLAAGCNVFGSLKSVLKKIKEVCKKELKRHYPIAERKKRKLKKELFVKAEE